MKLKRGLLLTCGVFLSLLASVSFAAQWQQKSFTGGLRTVHVYVPETKSPIGEGRSLFVVLRGCLQPASAFKTANLDKVADEYGMVIAAAEPNTSAGADCWGYWSGMRSRTSGDYKNVITTTQAMIDDAQYDIDPDQVYIGGLSSGGAFAMTVGCLAPDIYAAMALDAAPSAGTGMYGAFSHEGTPESVKRNCESYAGSYKSHFATQITTTAYGTTDGTVPKTYGLQNAKAMALIYDVDQTNEENTVQGFNNVKESTWEKGRVSMVEFGGVGHAWPGGSGAAGSYIDGRSANYGLYMAEFFTANNLRVEDKPVETCKNVTLDSFDYNSETKVFKANGTATKDCDEATISIAVAESTASVAPTNDSYSFTIQNVSCPDEIKVTLENASLEQFTAADMFTGSCGETNIPPVIKSFNAITTKGAVSLSGIAEDEDGTVVNAVITLEGTQYDVDVGENGVFTLMIEGLAAREYTARVIVMDDDALTDDALTTFTIEESEKTAPTLTLDPVEIYENYAVVCGTASDSDGEIVVANYAIDGKGKEINMNPDGSFCIHMPDLTYDEHELIVVVVDNDNLAADATVKFTISEEKLLPPTVALDPVEVVDQTAIISGIATDADGEVTNVNIDINGTAYPVVLSGGKFVLTLNDLEAGNYHVVAVATDNDQMEGSDTADFEIKEIIKIAPKVTVAAKVSDTSVTISGSASDEDGKVVEITISVNGTEYSVAGGNYSKTLTDLAPGDYDVVVTATDNDGLTATDTTSFAIEEEDDDDDDDDDVTNPWTSWWSWWMGLWGF